MNKNYNYNLLATKIKEITNGNAELSKAIYKLIDQLSIDCRGNKSDILFITMKEFVREYGNISKFTDENVGNKVLQYFHYLGNLKVSEVIEMLNFLELCKQ